MAITKPTVITESYCALGTPGTDYITPPASGSATVQSQDNGWPEVFQQALPPNGSGLPITRQQFNGVHNLYSSHNFWLQSGGTYTYETTVATANTGYPAGQLLWSATANAFQLSLVNSNTANFISTPSYLDDGVHWKQVNNPYSTLYNSSYVLLTNKTLTKNDACKNFVANASSVTITCNAFTASPAIPNGFVFYASADSGFGLTLSLTNLINVTNTFIIIPTDPVQYRISYNGTWFINGVAINAFITSNSNSGLFFQSVPAAYTFTVPVNVRTIYVTACGGGGGGATSSGAGVGAGGGGSGAGVFKKQFSVTPGAVINITIGAGGAIAGNGSATSFTGGISQSLNGGSAGASGVTYGLGGAAGSGAGTIGNVGGAGTGISGTFNQGGSGGGSVFMSGPQSVVGGTVGANGVLGCGGGGGSNNQLGGTGGAGAALIEW